MMDGHMSTTCAATTSGEEFVRPGLKGGRVCLQSFSAKRMARACTLWTSVGQAGGWSVGPLTSSATRESGAESLTKEDEEGKKWCNLHKTSCHGASRCWGMQKNVNKRDAQGAAGVAGAKLLTSTSKQNHGSHDGIVGNGSQNASKQLITISECFATRDSNSSFKLSRSHGIAEET